MCLAVPAKIVEIDGDYAKADFGGGVFRKIGIQMVPDIKKGEFCLVHAGFGVEKITKEYAEEAKGYLEEMLKHGPHE